MPRLEMDELGAAQRLADDLTARRQVAYAILERDIDVKKAWAMALENAISVPDDINYPDRILYNEIITHGAQYWNVHQQQCALRGEPVQLSAANMGPIGWGL